jgi:membrane fusion protein (multidrug efflux system)
MKPIFTLNNLSIVGARPSIKNMAALCCLCLGLLGCDQKTPPAKLAPPAVGVFQLESEELGKYLEFVARTEAFQSADIKARVEGELLEKSFEEGSYVEKDQLLLRIDPVEYKASQKESAADLNSKQAEAENAQRNLDRGLELSKGGYISQSDLDELKTRASQSSAAVKAAQAELEKANLNLQYTEIRAPFSGFIGKAMVDVGNIIGPSSNTLVSLSVIDPINVDFQLDESLYLTYVQNNPKNPGVKSSPFELSLRLSNNTMHTEKGRVDFADVKIDQGMGTVALRAIFANPKGVILPGQFVTLISESKQKEEVVLVPQAAVQANMQGKFVLVVDGDNKVSTRIVKLGRRINAMWAVESGLQAGEKILIDGLQKVRPGVVVAPTLKQVDAITGTVSSAQNQ